LPALNGLRPALEWETFKNHFAKAVINFQVLETAIKDAIAFLVNESDERLGRIMTHRIPFPHLLKKLCALVDHKLTENADELGKLKQILKEWAEHEGRRNQLVHSHWYPNPEGIANRLEVEISRGGVTYRENREEFSGDSIELWADGFRIAREALHEFMARNFDTYLVWCVAE
jgi:hypothetical protein